MPDSPAQEYRKAILKARNQLLNPRGVPKDAYRGLMILYARMISDINKDIGNEAITDERAEQLKRVIIRRFNDFGNQIGVLFTSEKQKVIQGAVEGHKEAIKRATTAAEVSGLSVSFNDIPDRALESMMLRRGLNAKNYQSVIKRGLQTAASDIDQYLASAVGRGVSADRAAKELAGILSRNNDTVLSLVKDGRLMKSSINKAFRSGDIDVMDYKDASQILHDSRRIVVTEINTAHREADLLAQDRSPIVKASKWQVSGRHYGLPSSPCVCTVYHESDQFGLGPGVFPTRNFPSTPHPHCGCGPEAVIIEDPAQWGTGSEPLQEPTDFTEDQLQTMFSDKTDNHMKRQVDTANKYLNLAYQFADKRFATG